MREVVSEDGVLRQPSEAALALEISICNRCPPLLPGLPMSDRYN